MEISKQENVIQDWNELLNFNQGIEQLVKAKEKMAASAVSSKDPQKIKAALTGLLVGNRALIAALDAAYQKLSEARKDVGNP